MQNVRFELFDHTADLGVRVWAPTLPELVQPAVDGLYACIGTLVPAESDGSLDYDFENDEPGFPYSGAAELLREYLAELLFWFEMDHVRVTTVEVQEFTENRIEVRAASFKTDAAKNVYDHEVKAITYHELNVREVPGGFEATYIVDI